MCSSDLLPAVITAIAITIQAPAPGINHRPRPRHRREPTPGTLRHRLTTLMNTDPGRPWTGRELAAHLHLRPPSLFPALAHWTNAGHLIRTSPATYALPTTPNHWTNSADP